MRYVDIKGTQMKVSRLGLNITEHILMDQFVLNAIENGINLFDCSKNREVLGNYIKENPKSRKKIYIQARYEQNGSNLSQSHILQYVDDILRNLHTDYLDILMLNIKDILFDPLELALTFDVLYASGKVKYFGVINAEPIQIKLINKHSKNPIVMNHIDFDLDNKGLVEVKRNTMNYCYLRDITVQATYNYSLHNKLSEIGYKYGLDTDGMSLARLLRLPCRVQVLADVHNMEELESLIKASDIKISREDFYKIYY